jgi:hypothetical protein
MTLAAGGRSGPFIKPQAEHSPDAYTEHYDRGTPSNPSAIKRNHKLPTTFRLDAIIMITDMSGAATSPFGIAAQ